MKNVKLVFSYDGSKFNGWHGDCGNTQCTYIQTGIENALKVLFKKDLETNPMIIKAICAGRTDAGVHALRQVCSFKIPREFCLERLSKTLEHFVKISVRDIEYVSDDFNARHSATQREYMYIISYEKSPIIENRTLYSREKWDLDLLKEMCDFLVGNKNLAFFAPYDYDGNTNKTIDYCYFTQSMLFDFQTINIRIAARSFFHHQIRNIVGCMYYVCTGKWTMEKFIKEFNTLDRKNCPPMISSSGLYFYNVKYDAQDKKEINK